MNGSATKAVSRLAMFAAPAAALMLIGFSQAPASAVDTAEFDTNDLRPKGADPKNPDQRYPIDLRARGEAIPVSSGDEPYVVRFFNPAPTSQLTGLFAGATSIQGGGSSTNNVLSLSYEGGSTTNPPAGEGSFVRDLKVTPLSSTVYLRGTCAVCGIDNAWTGASFPLDPNTIGSWAGNALYDNGTYSIKELKPVTFVYGQSGIKGTFRFDAQTTLDTPATLGSSTTISNRGNFTLTATPNDTQSVPGPLPLMGTGAAFAWSRRLRARVKTQS